MVYIHKKSPGPIDPWPAVRHGGLNHLDGVRGKYLVLWNADIVQREGAWHYIFEFDVRDTLEMSALAQLVGGGKQRGYPNDMDWKTWLGPHCTQITAAVREEILNMPADAARTEAVITDMRELRNAPPVPGRKPDDWYRGGESPDDFLLTVGGL
jgi:hypothetical protein